MVSGESIDPRVIEAALNQCPAIVRSCVVGNNFLKTSSQVICAIVEPAGDVTKSPGALSEITRAIASANRSLIPPLRISWARVLVLKDQHIPITKKGAIFRKKLEQVFGDQLASLVGGSSEHVSQVDVKSAKNLVQGRTKDQVASIISNIIVETLRISANMLENNAQTTFAEVGIFFFALLSLAHVLY